jgi:Ca2+-transporting ATPase
MFQQLLQTTSLTGRQWVVVLALSLLAPGFVAADKALQLRRLNQQAHTSHPDTSATADAS